MIVTLNILVFSSIILCGPYKVAINFNDFVCDVLYKTEMKKFVILECDNLYQKFTRKLIYIAYVLLELTRYSTIRITCIETMCVRVHIYNFYSCQSSQFLNLY